MNARWYATIATLCWGCWGLLNKMATNRLYPAQVSIMVAATSFITIPIYFALLKGTGRSFVFDPKGMALSLGAGLVGAAANLAYLYAIQGAELSTVTGLTCIYPAITFVLSLLLFQETITTSKVVGMVMMAIGILIFSTTK